jgi:hypothetical protein
MRDDRTRLPTRRAPTPATGASRPADRHLVVALSLSHPPLTLLLSLGCMDFIRSVRLLTLVLLPARLVQ